MPSSASYTISNRRTWTRILARHAFAALLLTALTAVLAQPPKPPETPAQQTKRYFDGVNKQVLEMAQDFPADKDRKSTRLNSSHLVISYAVFCLKKKKKE